MWVAPSPAEPRNHRACSAHAARRPALSLALPIAAAIRKRFHLHANPPITTTYLLSRQPRLLHFFHPLRYTFDGSRLCERQQTRYYKLNTMNEILIE